MRKCCPVCAKIFPIRERGFFLVVVQWTGDGYKTTELPCRTDGSSVYKVLGVCYFLMLGSSKPNPCCLSIRLRMTPNTSAAIPKQANIIRGAV